MRSLAPFEIWKMITGEKKLTPDFIDWISHYRERFFSAMEKKDPEIRKRGMTDEERDVFSDFILITIKKEGNYAGASLQD